MRSNLCRGNGRQVWLVYDLVSSIRRGNVSKRVTKTEKVPRGCRELFYRTKNLNCALWKRKEESPGPELCASLKPEVRDFVEGTFDCFTTLFPQSVMEMFQKKSLILIKYQERVESLVIERRISIARCKNEKGSPLAHNSVQAWNRKCVTFVTKHPPAYEFLRCLALCRYRVTHSFKKINHKAGIYFTKLF